jgi:hypothetical protein
MGTTQTIKLRLASLLVIAAAVLVFLVFLAGINPDFAALLVLLTLVFSIMSLVINR